MALLVRPWLAELLQTILSPSHHDLNPPCSSFSPSFHKEPSMETEACGETIGRVRSISPLRLVMQKPSSDPTSTAIAFGKPCCPTIWNVQGTPRCNWSSSTFNGTCVSLKASSTIHVILTQLCLGGRFFSCCSLRSLRQTSPGWNPGGSSKLMQLARNRSTHVSPLPGSSSPESPNCKNFGPRC